MKKNKTGFRKILLDKGLERSDAYDLQCGSLAAKNSLPLLAKKQAVFQEDKKFSQYS